MPTGIALPAYFPPLLKAIKTDCSPGSLPAPSRQLVLFQRLCDTLSAQKLGTC